VAKKDIADSPGPIKPKGFCRASP